MFFQRERDRKRKRGTETEKILSMQGINMIFNMVHFKIIKTKQVFCKGIYSSPNV